MLLHTGLRRPQALCLLVFAMASRADVASRWRSSASPAPASFWSGGTADGSACWRRAPPPPDWTKLPPDLWQGICDRLTLPEMVGKVMVLKRSMVAVVTATPKCEKLRRRWLTRKSLLQQKQARYEDSDDECDYAALHGYECERCHFQSGQSSVLGIRDKRCFCDRLCMDCLEPKDVCGGRCRCPKCWEWGRNCICSLVCESCAGYKKDCRCDKRCPRCDAVTAPPHGPGDCGCKRADISRCWRAGGAAVQQRLQAGWAVGKRAAAV